MPSFQVKVRDHRGESFLKTVNGASAAEVRTRMREAGYLVVTAPVEKRERASADIQIPFLDSLNSRLASLQQVKLGDLTVFSRQFATMINAGVALVRALTILSEQTPNPKLKKAIVTIKEKVEAGSSLSDSMGKFPDIFDRLYVGMVRAGEAGGVLDEVLSRVAGFLEANNKLIHQVKAALTYPIVVSCLAVTIFWAMLTFILPIFAKMFASMGAQLPAYTQFLINLSDAIRGPIGIVIGVGLFGGIAGFRRFNKTEFGRHFVDRQLFRAPVFGPLLQKVSVARFSRTLGTLLKSGVPLLSALEIVRDSAGNTVVAGAVEDVRQAVREGEGIAKPLEKTQIFPPMVVQMIAVGEETGAIDAMLEKVADFYDSEVESAVKSLTSLLEPLMMVVIGGMVGSIVIGMYLPIFSIINTIKS